MTVLGQIKRCKPRLTSTATTATLWSVSTAGMLFLLLEGHLETLCVTAALLAGMLACLRTSLNRQSSTGKNVAESLDHFQKVDELVVDHAVTLFIQRLAESGIVVTSGPGPTAGAVATSRHRPAGCPDRHLATVTPLPTRTTEAS